MLTINKNSSFGKHNTSLRWGKVQWLVIHYVGATGDAAANVKYYNQPTTKNASADFFVGHRGDIWQYNPDPAKRYCWAVGGSKYANGGGRLYGKVTNKNSIHIEMCVKNSGGSMTANSPGWYFTDETTAAAIELTKHLMDVYGLSADKVIRHYDVNGKPCPGVVGWNALTGSEAAWKSFHAAISKTPAGPVLPYSVRVTRADLYIRSGPGTIYAKRGYIKPGVYTITAEADGKGASKWLKLKSGAGYISADFVMKL
jgi:N-acetylmuramoyl-L-alanine amidase CwlA